MLSSEASCSECKIELIERRWRQLLLKWINKCVSNINVKKLNPKSLADIMAKYNRDVCANDLDRAMLCTDDVEPFIRYKYPILRLRYLLEESDVPKRLYITTTIILYHCIMSSQTGVVDKDICQQLSKYEQELILKFCENLCAMEATVHNVESAIRGAFESVGFIQETEASNDQIQASSSSDTAAHASSHSTNKDSVATLPSDETIMQELKSVRLSALKFNSSVTVLPSVMADASTYSGLISVSDDMTEKDLCIVDSDDFNVLSNESVREELKIETIKEPPKKPEENKHKEKTEAEIVVQEKTAQKKTMQKFIVGAYAESKHNVHEANALPYKIDTTPEKEFNAETSEIKNVRCLDDCSCARCSDSGPCCGDPGSTMANCEKEEKEKKKKFVDFLGVIAESGRINCKLYAVVVAVLFLIIIVLVASVTPFLKGKKGEKVVRMEATKFADSFRPSGGHVWECKDGFCQKIYQPTLDTMASYSRCSLICMGPQLWPYPIGYTFFSKKIISLATSKLEYKFQSLPSDQVHQYLAEAFKHFIGHLAHLEKMNDQQNDDTDLPIKKMSIQINIESDPEPRLRLNTEESYHLKVETVNNQVVMKVSSTSFCGVRHGLETLSQLILLDQHTGKLITLSNAVVIDAPSYKYRGLMIDTARNFIPVPDLMRTIDAMATVKLNTFHWRISDVTSFPLLLPKLPQLFEYGAYDRSMVYTKDDVKAIVRRAGFRGIRVLMEIAAPGPVGRPWSWSTDVSCPRKNQTSACNNVLCLRLSMQDTIFDTLQQIYSEILEMTEVDDIFHLSDGIFSLSNCYQLLENREGFLDKALVALKLANNGFMPKLPVVWYTPRLASDYEARTWDKLGVQLNKVEDLTDDKNLAKFKVIHSSKWDLSCEMKKQRCYKYRTWQQMYSWKSWRNIQALTIEGGEAMLWTDLVDGGNLDTHLWPRAAAVAERLWSDIIVNVTAQGSTYVRLESQRWRMLFHGIHVQPVWPVWCSYNPGVCLEKLQIARSSPISTNIRKAKRL